MSIINSNYSVEPGQFGKLVIIVTGRCLGSDAAAIALGCCRNYELVKIPHSTNVVFKSLDGVAPTLVSVTPPTIGIAYPCVKVEGYTQPMAPLQTGGPYTGNTVLRFTIKYQEVNSIA